MCPPCPRTPVQHVSSLYSVAGRGWREAPGDGRMLPICRPSSAARPTPRGTTFAPRADVGSDDRSEGRARVIIEGVQPSVDGGAFPAKRVEGDEVAVEADIFADGHDLI